MHAILVARTSPRYRPSFRKIDSSPVYFSGEMASWWRLVAAFEGDELLESGELLPLLGGPVASTRERIAKVLGYCVQLFYLANLIHVLLLISDEEESECYRILDRIAWLLVIHHSFATLLFLYRKTCHLRHEESDANHFAELDRGCMITFLRRVKINFFVFTLIGVIVCTAILFSLTDDPSGCLSTEMACSIALFPAVIILSIIVLITLTVYPNDSQRDMSMAHIEALPSFREQDLL